MNHANWLGALGVAVLTAASVALPASSSPASTAKHSRDDARGYVIRARANIYGAGRSTPPDPGGGGAGVLPTVVRLGKGSGRVVSFPSVTGRVTPITGHAPWNGPEGDEVGPTNVKSYQGISGIVHKHNGMFLVGVFLTDAPPAEQSPRRLDFTRRAFVILKPRIGQTFLIGHGKERSYRVPPAATRLFLGFADGYFYQGPPGWYGNNSGRLLAAVRVTRS